MRRFASIDFLRGFAIWLMLLLHELMRVLDYSWATDPTKAQFFSEMPIIYTILMLLIMFLGGWCGFFLLISSIGNTISMQKALQKGNSVGSVVIKQLLLGFLLLLCAFFIESIGGYGSMLGQVAMGRAINPSLIYRSFWCETIHAIAYAMIANAFLGGLLAIRGGIKKTTRNIIINLSLAIVVIGVTAIVYNAPMTYGGITKAQDFGLIQLMNQNPAGGSVSEFFIKIFLFPFIGRPEPILPFLATALIGNVIGILLAREKPFWKEMRIGMVIAAVLTFGGLVWAFIMVANGKQDLLQLFRDAWNIPSLVAWLPMYLFTLGTQLVAVFLVIRLVEFRGRGKEFAEKTRYFRRQGFVALSIYAYQFLDVIPRWIMSLFLCIPYPTTYKTISSTVGFLLKTRFQSIPYWIISDSLGCTQMVNSSGVLVEHNLWGPWVFLVIVLNFLIWQGLLLLWEKVSFIGGYEWLINVIAGFFIKSRRIRETAEGTELYPWWKPKRLDAQAYLYDVDWINIIEKKEINHKEKTESIVALKVTAINLVFNIFIFFLPVTIFGLMVTMNARKTEGKNSLNTAALICGILGFVVCLISIIVMSNIPNSVLGLV